MLIPTLIKIDAVDRIGKSILTVMMALVSMMTSYISYTHTHEIGGMILMSITAAEIMILTIIHRRVWIECKCIPMGQFTLIFIISYIRAVPLFGSFGALIYYTFMVMLAVVSVVKMFMIDNSNEKECSLTIRMCLAVFLLLDMGNALTGIVGGYGGIEVVADFLSHVALLGAIMLLYLPGYLNIRRIVTASCLYFGTGMVMFMIMDAIVKSLGANCDQHIILWSTSAFMAMLITLICSGSARVHPDIDDEFDYTPKEKLLKTIGWVISDAERFNRRKLLESACRRNFAAEYTNRLYGELDCLEDIVMIQQRLEDIWRSIEELNADTRLAELKIEKLEEEGADLLGRLSIVYGLDTGISCCSMDLLREKDEGGIQ